MTGGLNKQKTRGPKSTVFYLIFGPILKFTEFLCKACDVDFFEFWMVFDLWILTFQTLL